MKLGDTLPFGRGETFYGVDGTIDTAALLGTQYEGCEYDFPDMDYSGGEMTLPRTNKVVHCIILRNLSGGALLPSLLVTPDYDAATYQLRTGQTDALSASAEKGYAVDEFLPAAGVRNGDLFWAVVKGPAKIKTAASGDTNFAANDSIKCSGSGLCVQADETVAGEWAKCVGRALEAINATSTLFLCDMGKL